MVGWARISVESSVGECHVATTLMSYDMTLA